MDGAVGDPAQRKPHRETRAVPCAGRFAATRAVCAVRSAGRNRCGTHCSVPSRPAIRRRHPAATGGEWAGRWVAFAVAWGPGWQRYRALCQSDAAGADAQAGGAGPRAAHAAGILMPSFLRGAHAGAYGRVLRCASGGTERVRCPTRCAHGSACGRGILHSESGMAPRSWCGQGCAHGASRDDRIAPAWEPGRQIVLCRLEHIIADASVVGQGRLCWPWLPACSRAVGRRPRLAFVRPGHRVSCWAR